MKKTMITATLVTMLSLALLGSSFASTFASATSTTTPETNVVNTTAVTEADTSIETEVNTSIETEADTSIETEVDNSIETEADTSIETEADTTAETEHTHNWQLLGWGDLGFTVICECGSQYSTPFEPCEHVLSISFEEITNNFHAYECEYCPYYARMSHQFDYAIDETAHYWACIECGYEASEEEHIFENITFDAFSHTNECNECGYIVTEEHQFIADIESDFTIIHCDSCDYIAEKRCNHDNTYMIGELGHAALCRRCYEFVDEQHTFYDDVCECGYEAIETTQFGIVTDFFRTRNDEADFVYYIEMLIDHEYYEFSFASEYDFYEAVEIEEGSFVEVNLWGNEVIDITCHVDYNVVDDEENFENYVSAEIMDTYSFMDYVDFDDLIIEHVEYIEFEFNVEFERVFNTFYYDYTVYDLRSEDMGELCEGDAVLYFIDNEVVYFIVIW